MGDDHSAARNFRCDLRQALSNVLVGKAVKSVAPDAIVMELVRDRVVVRDLVVVAVKGRIEAGDLRQSRKIGQQRPDRRQIVGLMQRCQRNVTFQTRHDRMVDQHRAS